MPDEAPTVRNAKTLADVFEPHLETHRKRGSLRCESEDEAVLLAHELKKRGWRAKVGKAMLAPPEINGEWSLVHVVDVSGRSTRNAR